jgi:hypothetical protein
LEPRRSAYVHQGADAGYFGLNLRNFGIGVVLCAGKTRGQEN